MKKSIKSCISIVVVLGGLLSIFPAHSMWRRGATSASDAFVAVGGKDAVKRVVNIAKEKIGATFTSRGRHAEVEAAKAEAEAAEAEAAESRSRNAEKAEAEAAEQAKRKEKEAERDQEEDFWGEEETEEAGERESVKPINWSGMWQTFKGLFIKPKPTERALRAFKKLGELKKTKGLVDFASVAGSTISRFSKRVSKVKKRNLALGGVVGLGMSRMFFSKEARMQRKLDKIEKKAKGFAEQTRYIVAEDDVDLFIAFVKKNFDDEFEKMLRGEHFYSRLSDDCDAMNMVVDFCVQHFDTMIQRQESIIMPVSDPYPGISLLRRIVGHRTVIVRAAKTFKQPALNNFDKLAQHREGIELLKHIMEHYRWSTTAKRREVAKAFTQPALNNFGKLVQHTDGIEFLIQIMEFNPDAAKDLAQFALDNLDEFAKSYWRGDLLSTILLYYPDAAKGFTQLALDNFDELAQNKYGQRLLSKILKRNPDAAKGFTQLALDNFDELAQHEYGRRLLSEILWYYPEACKAFTQAALNNVDKLVQCEKGVQVLFGIMCYNPDVGEAFIQLVSENYDIPQEVFRQPYTQTAVHILSVFPSEDLVKINKNKHLRKVFLDALQKEQELYNDYYTFYHGQKKEYLLALQLDTVLRHGTGALKNNFLSMHVNKQESLAKYVGRRILSKLPVDQKTMYSREDRLYLNDSFFGNCRNWGSSSFYHFSENSNIRDISKPLQDVFACNGYSDLYKKYETELEELGTMREKLYKCGTMHLIAVPKNKINKYVFPYNSRRVIGEEKPSRDMRKIMETIRKNPRVLEKKDNKEYYIPMYQDIGLDPNSGIKVFPFTAPCDPELEKEYQQKKQELMQKLERDVQIKKQAKRETKRILDEEI